MAPRQRLLHNAALAFENIIPYAKLNEFAEQWMNQGSDNWYAAAGIEHIEALSPLLDSIGRPSLGLLDSQPIISHIVTAELVGQVRETLCVELKTSRSVRDRVDRPGHTRSDDRRMHPGSRFSGRFESLLCAAVNIHWLAESSARALPT